MKPSEFFRYCPRCGVAQGAKSTRGVFECAACNFRLYFSSAASAAAFIQRADGQALLIRRSREPGLGRLAPPGGFIDIGERAEDALRREVREEVGLELAEVRFLCSQTNLYVYAEVTYPVLDLFFGARAVEGKSAAALEDVASVTWCDPRTVDGNELAFPSMQEAWRWAMAQGHFAPPVDGTEARSRIS